MNARRVGMVITLLVILAAWIATPPNSSFKTVAFYQGAASPGDLSAAHAHLENKCSACHTPVNGVDSIKCISCHANEESILNRQPTAFHANIAVCDVCHREHQGSGHRPTRMDHESLAKIGLNQLKSTTELTDSKSIQQELVSWANRSVVPHQHISDYENLLNCSACHSNDDRHFALFGRNCASCHATDRWTIAEFQHPSSDSRDCAHCHQAPPSHYMMHFKMISQRVAGKHDARVDQCFECHQTTAWNDIKNAGWYKHH